MAAFLQGSEWQWPALRRGRKMYSAKADNGVQKPRVVAAQRGLFLIWFWISAGLRGCQTWHFLLLCKVEIVPWLGALSCLGIVLQTERPQVQFCVRAHAWVAALVPGQGTYKRQPVDVFFLTLVFLSLFSPLHSPLSQPSLPSFFSKSNEKMSLCENWKKKKKSRNFSVGSKESLVN